MDKLKLVFTQALMITTGIVFAVGLEGLYYHLIDDDVVLCWYHMFSFILAGILGALPTLLFTEKKVTKLGMRLRWVLHFVLLLAVISLMGYVFEWYTTLEGYMFVAAAFVLIYGAVVAGSIILIRREEALINRALDDIRDEE